MPVLTVVPRADQHGFVALRGAQEIIHLAGDAPIEVGGLEGGMASGKPSVAFAFTLPDGSAVLAETSLALLLSAADALKAVYGDPR